MIDVPKTQTYEELLTDYKDAARALVDDLEALTNAAQWLKNDLARLEALQARLEERYSNDSSR